MSRTTKKNLTELARLNQRPTRAAVLHLNFRAGTTFLVPVCTVSPGHWVNKADTQYD